MTHRLLSSLTWNQIHEHSLLYFSVFHSLESAKGISSRVGLVEHTEGNGTLAWESACDVGIEFCTVAKTSYSPNAIPKISVTNFVFLCKQSQQLYDEKALDKHRLMPT